MWTIACTVSTISPLLWLRRTRFLVQIWYDEKLVIALSSSWRSFAVFEHKEGLTAPTLGSRNSDRSRIIVAFSAFYSSCCCAYERAQQCERTLLAWWIGSLCRAAPTMFVALLFPSVLLKYEHWTPARERGCQRRVQRVPRRPAYSWAILIV